MLSTICMPKLSPTMTIGTIAKWYKSVGDSIKPGDLLIEVATDKATIEHTAIEPGFLRQILVPEGKSTEVGSPIAVISETLDEPLTDLKLPQPVSQQKEEAPSIAPVKTSMLVQKSNRIPASPLARKIALQEGLSLEGIKGSGPGGRIMRRDLEIPLLKKQPSPAASMTFAVPEGMTLTPLSPMRTAIAKNLQYAKSHIPHFYISTSVDVSKLSSERERLKTAGVHLTVNDLIIVATAKALMLHPDIRSSFFPDKNALGVHENADIAVAVSVPGGLITPIIKAANTKSVFSIAKEVRELADKARQGKLLPHEYMGGAITITNLGMYGVDQFLPILNAPQVAILSIGAISDDAIVCEGKIVIAKIMKLTVAADHRAVDGTAVAAFLKALQKLLQEPEKLVAL